MHNNLFGGERSTGRLLEEQHSTQNAGSAGGWDYLLLVVVLTSYVILLPEAPHLDGVRWAQSLEAHRIDINPNYLLMEPLALAVYSAAEALGLPSDGVQFQKYLDVLAGTCAVWLLDLILATLVIPRLQRTICLLLMAFSYNFFYLSTSDHIKLITAPFLMATILFLVKYSQNMRTRDLKWAGISMGLALSTLINALSWFSLLVLLLFSMGGNTLTARIKLAMTFGAAALAPVVLLFGIAYIISAPDKSFLAWFTSYGSHAAKGEVGFGGVTWLTISRAVTAIIKNFAFSSDLGPIVKALILGTSLPSISITTLVMNVAASLAVVWMLLRITAWLLHQWRQLPHDERLTIGALLSAVVGYFLFGFFWNTSEEEFWFQITGPVAILVAIFLKHRPASLWPDTIGIMVAVFFVVTNTLVTFAWPRHAYPYFQYVDNLGAVIGTTHLLIHDGSEPVNGLVYGLRSKSSIHAIGVASALEQHGYDLPKTLAFIEQEIQRTRAQGGRVYLLDVFAAQSTAHPWTLLRERFGIQKEDVTRFLEQFGPYRPIQLAGQAGWVLE